MHKTFKSQKTICLLELTLNSSLLLGIISFLNYITSRSPPLDQNATVIPTEKSRLGIGPVPTALPAEDEGQSLRQSPNMEEKNLPNAEL